MPAEYIGVVVSARRSESLGDYGYTKIVTMESKTEIVAARGNKFTALGKLYALAKERFPESEGWAPPKIELHAIGDIPDVDQC